MKYLHIMFNEKFNTNYILFLEKHFKIEEHIFLFSGGVSRKSIEILDRENIIDLNSYNILKKIEILYRYSKESKKIIIHGLFDKITITFFSFFTLFLEKTYWGVWGGDLYSFLEKNRSLKRNTLENFKARIIKKIGFIVTQVPGDYELGKKWYGAKGKYIDCFMYPSNTFKDNTHLLHENNHAWKNILIGNSAFPSNNHKEIIDKLAKINPNNCKFYTILSYGEESCKREIMEYGQRYLVDKFVPIVDFMKYDEYIDFLNKIDIAIFAHDRQQAVGNITTLLGYGKTVYLKKEVSTCSMLDALGIKYFDFNNMNELKEIDDYDKIENIKIIKERFSEERLLIDLKKLFF